MFNFKSLIKRKPKHFIEIGINTVRCSECEKMYKGIELFEMFNQGPKKSLLLQYDKENETFLINEDIFMRAIQLVSPLQKPRKLKIISNEEWFDFKNGAKK